MRREGDGKDNGLLNLAAGLLGVGFDDLKQRDHERRLRRLRMLVALSVSLVAVFAALGVALFFQGEETKRQRNEAEYQRAEAVKQKGEAEHQRNDAQTQRTRAEEKEALVGHTLSQSDYMPALERLDNRQPDLALAHLARSIRTSNHRDSGMRADLLEGISGCRLDEGGRPKMLDDPQGRLRDVGDVLAELPEEDRWARLGRWFLADGDERRVSVSTNLTLADFITREEEKIRGYGPDESYWADQQRDAIFEVAPDWADR